MALLQGQVGAPSNMSAVDGANYNWLLGKQAEAVVAQLHGKYYTETYRGNMFAAAQAIAGVAVPQIQATTQQCGIFNPAGSGVNVVMVRLNIGYGSVTAAPMGFGISYVTGCGGSYGTAQPVITAVTSTTVPINLSLTGQLSKVFFMASAITTVAPTLLMSLGINQLTTTAAANSALAFFDGKYDFDGTLIVQPGCAIFFGGIAATSQKVQFQAVWEEIPI